MKEVTEQEGPGAHCTAQAGFTPAARAAGSQGGAGCCEELPGEELVSLQLLKKRQGCIRLFQGELKAAPECSQCVLAAGLWAQEKGLLTAGHTVLHGSYHLFLSEGLSPSSV